MLSQFDETKHGSQCTYNVILRRFREWLLPWKSNKYYVFFCVRVRVWVPGRVGVCMRVQSGRLVYPTRNACEPYFVVICGFPGSTIFFNVIS